MAWVVEEHRGPASSHHGLELDLSRRAAHVFVVDRPAVVLGSAQPATTVDHAAVADLSAELVVRRSGGGLVLLEPDAQLWVDVVVPAGDRLWSADVGVAFEWLGETWAAALRAASGLAAERVEVHRGPMLRRAEGAVVCFAGLGSGEVTLDGRKVVGLSQRRTREGSRFQCTAPARFDAGCHLGVVAVAARTPALERSLRDEVGAVADVDELLHRLLAELDARAD